MKRVGCIGLGIMGSAMSANLVRAGFRVYGYDVVPARRARLVRSGGFSTESVSELAEAASILITSLPSAEALIDVCKNIQKTGKKGRIVVETSTLPIPVKEAARKILARAGAALLDCPLSGTGAQARSGDLAVSMRLWQKDMKIIGDFVRRLRSPAPLFKATQAIYRAALRAGYGDADTAAVCALLERR